MVANARHKKPALYKQVGNISRKYIVALLMTESAAISILATLIVQRLV